MQLATAQNSYFIYVESENKEPFSVLLNGKTAYSSSLNGFLTIPQLTKGGYILTIGFAQNKYPEQEFEIAIDDKDVGFLLRHLFDNRFVLQNLQTAKTINASNNHAATVEVSLKTESEKTSISNQSNNQSSPKPNDNVIKVESTPAATVAIQAKPKNRKAHKIEKPNPISDTIKATLIATKHEAVTISKKPVGILATEADFKELKASFTNAKTETSKLTLSKKAFETKSYTVNQLHKLCHAFLIEKYKMLFYEAAISHIYDSENALQLLNDIKQPSLYDQLKKALQ